MIDYSTLKHGKPRPKALEREDRRRVLERRDKAESAKAKARAKGQCEVWEAYAAHAPGGGSFRCPRKDAETHHLIGGIGRRGRGKSGTAPWLLRVCKTCHQEITRHILQPIAADMPADKVRFRRVR